MKTFFSILFATLFGTGCYTQVKSSGDYWGYTGTHEHENAQAIPNQQDTSLYLDSSSYSNDQRYRDDDGYSSGGTYYDDDYYNAPNWNYYNAPYLSLSFGFGWHRPWWNFGYSSYSPYCGTYNPYWDWYYQPGFSSYGCIAPIYPFYDPFYHPFYHPFYGERFGFFHDGIHGGFLNRGRFFNTGVSSGRITGGEVLGRGRATQLGRPGSISAQTANANASAIGRNNIQPRSAGITNSAPGRNAGRSQNFTNAPRNNPRLIPQNGRSFGRNTPMYGRGYSNSSVPRTSRPPGYSGSPRSFGGGGGYRSGGGYRGGGGVRSGGDRGSARDGGGRGR